MSKYERAQREAERKRRQEEWEATQEQKENEAINVEDLKQQDDMEKGKYLKMSILGDLNINPKKHREKQTQKKIEDLSKRPGTSAEGEAAKRKLKRPEDLPNFLQVTDPQSEELAEYDRLMRESKDLEGQEKIDKINEANRSRPNYGKMLWKPIQMLGDAFEWVDDQAGIPGTKIDVKHARNLITDPLDRLHPIAGLVGEILVPDTTDLLAGSGYVKRITTNTPALIRAIKKTALNFDNRILQNGYEAASGVVRTVKGAFEGVDAGTGGAKAMSGGGIIKGFGQNFVPPNPSEVHKITRKLLNEHVLVGGDRRFDYNAFRALFTGNKRGRLLEGWMQTTPHFQVKNWDKHRQELVDVFESVYGDVMQMKGIPRSQIQIDHLVTLRSTMPLYDGLKFGGPLWNKVQETLLRSANRYNPGNTLDNLDALDPGSHIVKSNFFNKRLGKDGEVFFTTERLKYMKESDANRMEVLKDWLKIQDEGTAILREAQNVWKTLYKIDNVELPEEILNKLSKIRIGEFSHPELRNLGKLRGIIKDIIKDEVKRSSLGLKDLTKAVDDRTELDAYKSVRQLQQDVDPADLPKTTKVKSKKKQLEKELTKEPKPKVEKKSKKKNPDQGELDI